MRLHATDAVLATFVFQLPAAVWAGTVSLSSASAASKLSLISTAIPVPPQSADNTWSRMENVFIFGDSWSDTSFDLSGIMPSPSSPLGNPPYPGTIATTGAKWPVYLTTQYNSSILETYVLARSGSTVNGTIIPHGSSLVDQVQQDFLPRWGERNETSWQPYTTLFVIEFGINDVNVALDMSESLTSIFDEIFVSYAGLADQLYQTGARNFLFMNMPPMERAPNAMDHIAPAIADWNMRLQGLAANLTETYRDSLGHVFDMHTFIGAILNNPSTFTQTAGIRNTTEACAAYYNEVNEVTAYDPTCGLPMREYFWLNNLHPTYTVHDAWAEQVANVFEGNGVGKFGLIP